MKKQAPGWNDPPPLSSSTENKPRNVLYKINHQNNTKVSLTKNEDNSLETSKFNDDNSAKMEENKNFLDIFEQLVTFTESIPTNSKKVEIVKKLNIMKEMWIENQLNEDVQQKICKFNQCLMSQDIEGAKKVYQNLVTNNGFYCASWIIAFKYILHHYSVSYVYKVN